ncbi:hypothetical protein GVN24_29415 [Rhizobium sp. CRIBSB]|nr:hypothetical protein [Rhizobium sp. CRIBSB]
MSQHPTEFGPDSASFPPIESAAAVDGPLLIILALLVAAVVGAVLAWGAARQAQARKLEDLAAAKYDKVADAVKAARAPGMDPERGAAALHEACRVHLGPVFPGSGFPAHQATLGKLAAAVAGADVPPAGVHKAAKVSRERVLEPARAGYSQAPGNELYILEDTPPGPTQQAQRRERAEKALEAFFEFWIEDAQGVSRRADRLRDIKSIQKAFAG